MIGAHGVTVAHAPGGKYGHGYQLLSGAALAALTGRSVACDFRSADIALGGQGAPLAPVADLSLRMAADEDRVILNLGGISNFTAMPAGATDTAELVAADAGPANLVLDAWMRRSTAGQQAFDAGGTLALGGRVEESVVGAMMRESWFAKPLPRSGGREQFGEPWLERFLSHCPPSMSDADRMATLVAIVAQAIIDQLTALPVEWRGGRCARVLVTGGGRHNRAVLDALRDGLPGFEVESIEAIGENGDAKEAVDFAWLARQRQRGTGSGIASVTGATRDCVAGALYDPSGTGS